MRSTKALSRFALLLMVLTTLIATSSSLGSLRPATRTFSLPAWAMPGQPLPAWPAHQCQTTYTEYSTAAMTYLRCEGNRDLDWITLVGQRDVITMATIWPRDGFKVGDLLATLDDCKPTRGRYWWSWQCGQVQVTSYRFYRRPRSLWADVDFVNVSGGGQDATG